MCSRIWISDGHNSDCLCLLSYYYAYRLLFSPALWTLFKRVEWLHVSRNVPKSSQRELPSKCRCTKKTPKEQLNPHYIFIPSLKGQLYMELFWIFASEKKCDSANERLLVKRRAGGRQLTIVPDITFFTRHHCTDIAPTNIQCRPQRWSIFQGDGIVNVSSLGHHCRQWFWQSWTITIECFLGGPTIGTNVFSMVCKILRAMVNNGFEVNDGVPGQDHITKWW